MPDIPVVPSPPPGTVAGWNSVREEDLHLRRSDTVLLTGWRRVADGEFSLTASWPPPAAGLPYDIRMLTQTVRQSGLLIAHAAYGVPLTHQTLLHHFDFNVLQGFAVPPDVPGRLAIEVSASTPKRPGRSVSSLGIDVRLLQGATLVARAASEFGWISPRVYSRIRGAAPGTEWNTWDVPSPLDPRVVRRPVASEVVLSPGDRPLRWQLRNDVRDVVLYDHPVDHVPGLALMEAAYQAALAALHPVPFEVLTFSNSFEKYTEFDRPCWIDAEMEAGTEIAAGAEVAVLITASQAGETVLHSRLTGRCGPAEPGTGFTG
ncbi:ScbA/BarX family gamma-butyrolactone biosynthesis protein [Streptomyces sp. NPDC059166]|uniref:ScbA/BarX family gamma-butyrolactone biosynthesis protein n=1 Tax=Streptomyces sp. NPDC059166 TaxID=3346752 RepID=UPI003674618D